MRLVLALVAAIVLSTHSVADAHHDNRQAKWIRPASGNFVIPVHDYTLGQWPVYEGILGWNFAQDEPYGGPTLAKDYPNMQWAPTIPGMTNAPCTSNLSSPSRNCVSVQQYNLLDGNAGLADIVIDPATGQLLRYHVFLNNAYAPFTETERNGLTARRQSFVCHELGHTLGLNHQEPAIIGDFALSSCMYFRPGDGQTLGASIDLGFIDGPSIPGALLPNAHDVDELNAIY